MRHRRRQPRGGGCPKPPILAGAQTADSATPEKGVLRCPDTSDFRARAVEQLAKHLAAAYLAYAMDLNFPDAMRYVRRQPRAGDLWTVAARFIFGAKSLIDRVHGR